MFDKHYFEWNQKRAKFIIEFFGGATYFQGKTVLDCGGGHGDLGAALYRLGSKIKVVDVRPEHLKTAAKKYPGISTQLVDLDKDWPFQKFDLILDLGLLSHLRNWENHLKNACSSTDTIIIETAVCDSDDPDLCIPIPENKNIYDRAYNGVGSYPSAAKIEKLLSEAGFTHRRFDDPKLNTNIGREQISYDWAVSNTNETNLNKRRMWIALRNREVVNPNRSLLLVNNPMQCQTLLPSTTIITSAIEPLNIGKKPGEKPRGERAVPPLPPKRVSSSPLPSPYTPPSASPSPSLPSSLPKPKAAQDYFIHTAHKALNPSDTGVIRLFLNYYEPNDKNRKDEIDYCLQKNLANHLIDVVMIDSQRPPTFQSIFAKVNEVTGPDDINIIAHADIWLDDTITLARSIKPKQLYALTPWDQHHANNTQFYNSSNNQDTWIVRGKIENVNAEFAIGKDSADNRLLYQFAKAGYKVFNPSRSIKTYQVDNCGATKPDRSGSIAGPHVFITPTELEK